MKPMTPAGVVLDCAGRSLDLGAPVVMGVLNITPDSFSDGGSLYRGGAVDADALCFRAEQMLTAGASILDIGAESTRPGAEPVAEGEELDRALTALELLHPRFDVVISLDTSTPSVMTEGARRGAGMINDVRALTRPGALEAACTTALPVCLMHMQGSPGTMQKNPQYRDVVDEVVGFLKERSAVCAAAGIGHHNILLDPGFGFGKTLEHNFQLLGRLGELVALGHPVLAGLSRKSMIAGILERGPAERVSASVGLAVIAAIRGARIIRAHDVAETFDALAMVAAMERFNL